MRLCGNLGITSSIFLVRGSMTPNFNCISKPDSLRKHGCVFYLYERGIWVKVPYWTLAVPIAATGKRERC